MTKRKVGIKQVNQYDKVLQENIEAALPGFIQNILHIDAVHSEELPDSVQHTKERKPDVLKKITDIKGVVFILHIEFQTKDDFEMAYRMAEYHVMLARLYKLPQKQFVIYIGEGDSAMQSSLSWDNFYFRYELISISSIDYRIFLRSSNPEEKMFALLGNFGQENPITVLTQIASEISKASKGELEKERRKNQFRILAQLRTLVSENIEIMEQVSSFFKEKNDIFYRVGEKKGIEIGEKKGIEIGEKETEKRKNTEFVKNLLMQTDFSISKIASLSNVQEEFVRKIKDKLQ